MSHAVGHSARKSCPRLQSRILVALYICLSISAPRADGKFLPAAGIRHAPDIPSQCALVIHRDGIETLVIETAFAGEGERFAWLVPLPATPLSIREAPADALRPLADRLQPEVIHLTSRYKNGWIVCSALLGLAWGLFGLALVMGWRRGAFFGTLLSCTVVVCFFGIPSTLGLGNPAGGTPVQGVGGGKSWTPVGHFETVSFTPAELAQVPDWLEHNRFAPLSGETSRILAAHAREGWHLVISRLRRAENASGRLLTPHPLEFRFPAKTLVYPLRLTASATRRLRLELVVVSDHAASAPPLAIDHADAYVRLDSEQYGKYFQGLEFNRVLGNPYLLTRLWPGCHVTRLSGILGQTEMTRDLALAQAEDAPFRRVVYSPGAAIAQPMEQVAILLFILSVAGFFVFWKELAETGWKRLLTRVFIPVLAIAGSFVFFQYLRVDKLQSGQVVAGSAWPMVATSILINIAEAERNYARENGGGEYAPISILRAKNFLNERFSSGSSTLDGYKFSDRVAPGTFTIFARNKAGLAGLDLYIKEDGVVRWLDGTPYDLQPWP